MKKFIITSDKYSFCLDGFQKLQKKYWDNNNFTILGFKKPNLNLNSNYEFISFGETFDDKSDWVDFLVPFFENIEDDFFFLCFEDHFLIEPVNLDFMDEAERIMIQDNRVGKIRMHPPYTTGMVLEKYDENFYTSPTGPHSYIATSLRPAIWRKSLFLKLLTHTYNKIKTPHDFESFNDVLQIDTTVLVPKLKKPIYPDLDAMRKGNLNPLCSNVGVVDMDYYFLNLTEEDYKIFQYIKNTWNAIR